MTLTITKRDGTREAFNADNINRSIERACVGLSDPIAMVTQIATETKLTLYDGITTEEMDQATINASVQNIKDDVEYDRVATRLLLKTIYKKVVGNYDNDQGKLRELHTESFAAYIERGIALGKLDVRMKEKYDLAVLSAALDLGRDELFQYAGLSSLLDRYIIKDVNGEPLETPQYFFMRVAMGLAYNEKNPTEWARKFYDKMSKLDYLAGGSTNLASGTTRPALSNCFLLEIQDDMEHIAKSVSDVMLLSKGSGGIGASITKLRASGSPLMSTSGASTGPTPFAKIIDTAIRAIQRGGKKKGALCFYMENWHIDFAEFIDWKHNAGDDYLRMRTANTAVFISDEFMNRVENGEDWYMFDPKETPDLCELYGQAFSKRYREYILMAEEGKLRAYKKMPASEQFRKILVALQTTSHPWLTWKDPINLRALNNNTGTIHMSNLCTEICLPQDRENVAVCNLASLNLATHVVNKEINWQKLEESVRLAVRQLDDLIDINQLPIVEAVKSDRENRAIGLGVMGFADVLEKLGLSYDGDHAYIFADRIFEFVSYMAIDESANLAADRGSYQNFAGSRWSQGMVPIDTIKILEEERGVPLTVDSKSYHKGLNWDILRAKVKKGMRNSTLMAIAPNANIGLVAGTVPGIDPRFSQVFSRNKISGKYLDINHNLVKDLKNLGIWDDIKEQVIEYQGDISPIVGIPQHIKDIYKTSFTTSPYAFVEVAARAQKWVDQALSRNMYLETRDIDETMDIYKTAWKKGVKTTYYLHMKPRHTAEQSTIRVNKAEVMGKKGFAAIVNLKDTSAFKAPIVDPVPSGSVITVTMPEKETVLAKPEPQVLEMISSMEKASLPEQKFAGHPEVMYAVEEVHTVAAVTEENLPKKPHWPQIMEQKTEAKSELAHAVTAVPVWPTDEKKIGFQTISPLAQAPAPQAAQDPIQYAAPQAQAPVQQTKPSSAPKVCPVDPMERLVCDSCQ